ncbi:MAG: rRNA maturation RNase YbeY [Candidatus Omnitrophota bacterium]
MSVSIKNSQSNLAIAEEAVKKIVNKIFWQARVKDYKVCIAFLNNKKIQRLNKEFLGHDYPTDVLTFPYQIAKRNQKQRFFTDIAISTEMVIKNSKLFRTSVQEELTLYIIHAVLHLLGFDDTTKTKRMKMERKQFWLLNKFRKDAMGICL